MPGRRSLRIDVGGPGRFIAAKRIRSAAVVRWTTMSRVGSETHRKPIKDARPRDRQVQPGLTPPASARWLGVARALPEAESLTHELAPFKLQVTAASETFRPGTSAATTTSCWRAAWLGERCRRVFAIFLWRLQ